MANVRVDPDLHNEQFQEHLDVDTDQRQDPQGLVNTIDQDTVSIPHSYEYHAGAMTEQQRLIDARAKEEQESQVFNDNDVIRATLNTSRQVRFRTYTLNAAMGAIKICDDKKWRGDVVISVQSGGPIFICDQGSCQPNGQNTAMVATGRVVRTNNDLYAVVATGVTCTFDVQEEFD